MIKPDAVWCINTHTHTNFGEIIAMLHANLTQKKREKKVRKTQEKRNTDDFYLRELFFLFTNLSFFLGREQNLHE